jgi:uncharacterized membrane protein
VLEILQSMEELDPKERRHMSIAPVQMLVLGFDDPKFTGAGLEELKRLREADIIRLIDLLAVWKDEDGDVAVLQDTQLSEAEAKEFGAVVGALVGFGMAGEEGLEAGAAAGMEALEDQHVLDADNVWYVADTIPNNSAAVIALIEHRWEIPLRDAVASAGGFVLADEWIHAKDLVAVGLMAPEEVPAAR